MKKVILTISLAFIAIVAFGQARLGSSITDIKSEFWESHYNLKAGYTDERDFYITIETERAIVVYYFNSDNICYSTCIVPDDQGALNYYVELYNNQYVIVSSTKWKMYSSGGIANVELIYTEDGSYYFIWS